MLLSALGSRWMDQSHESHEIVLLQESQDNGRDFQLLSKLARAPCKTLAGQKGGNPSPRALHRPQQKPQRRTKVAKAPAEAAPAPAASKKSSLKRKSDANDDAPTKAAKATTTTATEEAVKAPSPKKSKTTATSSPAAKPRVPAKPPTGLELRKHQRKTAEAIEKAKGPPFEEKTG
ncbi:hypothetical protein DFP72DRAFT_1065886 [Ephemerocybe angulata]|uniref:Uncharacterized protein n=1 Tax=Ephemerocybe angulata TaxID=980116 RepID=A0A8H6I312_9AGAR|nr:hypothetical protein DFP72DRAFT_1065886 [Tulosesus angulatus]